MYRECAWCLSNMACSGSKDQVEKLYYYDGIKALAKHLSSNDSVIVRVSLDGLQNIYNVSLYLLFYTLNISFFSLKQK